MSLSFRQITHRTLKTSRARKDKFLLALESLLSRHKPAILFDFCGATTDQLGSIVKQGGLKEVVLVVKLEYDIVLLDRRHDFVSEYAPVVIDCSSYRGTPVLAENDVCDQYRAAFSNMIKSVNETDEDQVILDLDSECKGLCLTTIFGFFLQYPYVYYTSDSGNCLAGVELILVELGFKLNHVTSDVTNHVTSDGTNHVTSDVSNHVFTTFSVPKVLCQTEEQLTSLPYYLRHRTVCLDSVAM